MEEQSDQIKEKGYTIYKDNGIIYCIYETDVVIDIHVMRAIIEARIALAEEIPCPIYIDATRVKYWTLEARKYGSSERALTDASAYGILINSSIVRIIANWGIKFYPTKGAPQRIFNEKEKALQWLEQFKQ